MNASVLVTEWGGGDGDIATNLHGTVHQQDLQFTGSTYWDWKQSKEAGCGWSLYQCATGPDNETDPNGAVDTAKLAVVSRVIPWAVVGYIHAFSYNSTTQVFAMRAESVAATMGTDARAASDGDFTTTLVYVPAHVRRRPSEVTVGGVATLSHVVAQPDGSWIVCVAVDNRVGEYTVQLGDGDGRALRALPSENASGQVAALESLATETALDAAYRAMAYY